MSPEELDALIRSPEEQLLHDIFGECGQTIGETE
jgi:hypothetical protein